MRINPLPNWAALALKNGPIFGSDPEGEPAGASVTTTPEEKPEGETKEITVSPEDAVKAVRERDAANLELEALRTEKTERETAEAQALAATRSREENQEAQITELTETNKSLTLVNEQNLLELAILKNNKFKWQDHNIALKLIDRADVKIDAKKGTVDGVDEALKTLAKEQPYLLAPAEGTTDGNGAGQSGASITPGVASGGKPGGGGDSSANANKRKKMEDRFQVLRV